MNGEFIYLSIFNQFYFFLFFSEFQIMKYWLSHLPLEVWVDVYRYPWISRKQLSQIVHRFCNHKFAEYLQFYLHDWGKHELKPIHFLQNGLHQFIGYYKPYRLNMPIPLTPVPSNIKRFEFIQIKHFDRQTLHFLRQISPLLTTGIKLKIGDISPSNLEILRTILAQLVPLLEGGTHSLCCSAFELPMVAQCFGGKLAGIKAITIFGGTDQAMRQATIQLLLNWLTLPPTRQDGITARFCEAYLYRQFFEDFTLAICQEFLAAKSRPSPFAVIIRLHDWVLEPVEFHLRNNIGEELHGLQLAHKDFQITRHPANCGKELQEWVEENQSMGLKSCHQKEIVIQSPTIGKVAPRMWKKSNGSRHQKTCCEIL